MKLENLKRAGELLKQIEEIEGQLEVLENERLEGFSFHFESAPLSVLDPEDVKLLATNYKTLLHNRRKAFRREVEGL